MKITLEIVGTIDEKHKEAIEKRVGEILNTYFASYKFKWEEVRGIEK